FVDVDAVAVSRALDADCGFGLGSGNKLAGVLAGRLKKRGASRIEASRESLDADKPDSVQAAKAFGSKAMFDELQEEMRACSDILVYIHGFNVSWNDAVASALALQEALNQADVGKPDQRVLVVLFSWPSDG